MMSTTLSLFPRSSPNEPVLLYKGEVVLRHDAGETLGTGSAELRWFPSPGIQLDVTVRSGPVPKLDQLDKEVSVELGALIGRVLLTSHSSSGINPTLPDRVGGFISSLSDNGTRSVAWLRFLAVNSPDFLTPGLNAVPGDPATVGITAGIQEVPWQELEDGTCIRKVTCAAAAIRCDSWEINLVTLSESSANYKVLREDGGYAFTHIGQIRRADGADFAPRDAAPTLLCLERLLSFARGAACSLPICWSADAKDRITWREFRSPIVDQWSGQSLTWFARHQGHTLTALFDEFCTIWEHGDFGDPFRRALDWYRRCSSENVGGPGALVLGVTALDLLGGLVVVDRIGTVSAKEYDKFPAKLKLRKLLEAMKVPLSIPERYKSLDQLATENGWSDVCEALTEIRHGFVHPKPERRRVVQKATHAVFEARCVSLWLQEVALLYVLEHRGDYTNRTRARSVGEVEPVPWEREWTDD